MDLLQLEFLWKLAEYMSRKFNFNFGRAKFKVIEDAIWYKHGELVVKKAPLKFITFYTCLKTKESSCVWKLLEKTWDKIKLLMRLN